MHDEPWAFDGPPTDYERTFVPLNRDKPKKRSGKTPEALVSAACDAYLKLIGALCIRANAGSWQDDSGHVIMGAKAGTSDKVLCVAGRFVALEIKAAKGKQSDAQKRFQARVETLGGLYILAHSKDELREALFAAFGLDTIVGWELAGKARAAEKKKRT